MPSSCSKIKEIKKLLNSQKSIEKEIDIVKQNLKQGVSEMKEEDYKRLTMKDFKTLMEEQEKRRSADSSKKDKSLTEFLSEQKQQFKTPTKEFSEETKSSKASDPILNQSPEAGRYMSGDDSHQGFDQNVVNKQVLKKAFLHPSTLVPASLGALCFVVAMMSPYSVILGSIGAGMFVFGGVSFNFNFFKRKSVFVQKYLDTVRSTILEERRENLLVLDSKLKANSNSGISDMDAVRSVRQLVAIQKKYNGFLEVLDTKLNKGEVTYFKYQNAAEQTNLAVIKNLNIISSLYDALKTIDKEYLQSRLKEISEQSEKDENDDQEIDELNKRLKMYNENLKKIDNLLNENEKAFTAMDNATLSLGKVQTTKSAKEQSLDEALKELDQMSNNASKYEAK